MIFTGQTCGSIVMLLQIVLISLLFEIIYSIINCYAMWCASLAYAKFIQMVSVILYLGSVFSIMLTPVKLNLFNSPGVLGVIIIMSVYSLRCLKKITKEGAINTLQYWIYHFTSFIKISYRAFWWKTSLLQTLQIKEHLYAQIII